MLIVPECVQICLLRLRVLGFIQMDSAVVLGSFWTMCEMYFVVLGSLQVLYYPGSGAGFVGR